MTFSFPPPLFLLALVAIWLMIRSYRTYACLRMLKRRGYVTLRWRDAWWVINDLGRGVSRLPEAATLDQYGFDNIGERSLVKAFRQYYHRPANGLWLSFGATVYLLVLLPLISRPLLQMTFGGRAASGIIAALAAIALFLLLREIQGVKSLRGRGYDWVNLNDTWYLRRKLGRRIRDIPPRDQLRVTSGFRDYDPAAIVERMNAIQSDGAATTTTATARSYP